MALTMANTEQVGKHMAQADASVTADTRCRHRIENGIDIEIEILFEADQVEFGGVENLLYLGIGEDTSAQGADVVD